MSPISNNRVWCDSTRMGMAWLLDAVYGGRLVDVDERPTVDEGSARANIGLGKMLDRDDRRMKVDCR